MPQAMRTRRPCCPGRFVAHGGVILLALSVVRVASGAEPPATATWPQVEVQGKQLSIRNEFRHAQKHATDDEVLAAIGDRRDWEAVSIEGCPEITDAVLDRLAQCPALESVRIESGRFSDAAFARLAEIKTLRACDLLTESGILNVSTNTFRKLAALPVLEELSLSVTVLDDDALIALAAAPRLSRMTLRNPDDGRWDMYSDELGGCRYVPGERRNTVSRQGLEALTRMTALRHLGISTDNVSSEDAALLATLPSLESLAWNCWPGAKFYTQKFDGFFFRALANAPKLKALRVWSPWSKVELADVGPLLARGQLTALSLSVTVPPEEHGALLAAVAQCGALEDLSLSEYAPTYTDADFAQLAPLTRMRILRLRSPHFTDAALVTMADWDQLEVLSLLPHPGDSFLAWAEKRPALRRLDDTGTRERRYTAEAVRHFQTERPDCEIVPFPWSLFHRQAASSKAQSTPVTH